LVFSLLCHRLPNCAAERKMPVGSGGRAATLPSCRQGRSNPVALAVETTTKGIDMTALAGVTD
jgi:hypothetical protein